MSREFSIPIDAVVQLLGLKMDPKSKPGAESYNVRCPFCGDKKYHMNINRRYNTYRCLRCSGDERNLGVLDLYGRIRNGERVSVNHNSKELYIQLKEELGNSDVTYAKKEFSSLSEIAEIYPAEDKTLDSVYSALLKLPYLSLTEEHRVNLHERGLDDCDIAQNGYASLRSVSCWAASHPGYTAARKTFLQNRLSQAKSRYPRLKRISDAKIIGGMLIASDLISQGLDLERIPGFYTLEVVWSFCLDVGMLVPTRNHLGEIVGLQVRRDNAKEDSPRYITVSSKGLEGGVTKNITRVHFPLANNHLGADAEVLLTEGPLKADVAVKLYPGNAYFMAIQGVDNTRELPRISAYLRSEGVSVVMNALDMDKLTNPHVAAASARIRKKFAADNISFIFRCWDSDFAYHRLGQIKEICQANGIPYVNYGRISTNITKNIENLISRDADVSTILAPDETLSSWRKATKGIDDFLMSESGR